MCPREPKKEQGKYRFRDAQFDYTSFEKETRRNKRFIALFNKEGQNGRIW